MKYMSFGGTKYLEYTNKYLFSTDSVGLLVYFYQVFLHTSFPNFVPDQSLWRVHIIQKDVLLAMYISIQKRLPMHGKYYIGNGSKFESCIPKSFIFLCFECFARRRSKVAEQRWWKRWCLCNDNLLHTSMRIYWVC